MKNTTLLKQKVKLRRPLVTGALVGIAGALLAWGGMFNSWSLRATDRFFLEQTPDPSIVIVAIDDASIQRIGRWPWDRSVHADLIRKLANAGAKVIGYDVNFAEEQNTAEDAALASAIINAKNVVLPVELELVRSPFDLTFNPLRTLRAMPSVDKAAVRTGYSNTPQDADGIVRRVPVALENPDGSGLTRAFGFEIASLASPSLSVDQVPRNAFGEAIIHYVSQPGTSFTTYKAADVLDGNVDQTALQGKIVLVGSTAPDLHDDQVVPTSLGKPMAGVEIHASLANTLLTRHWLVQAPVWVAMLVLILIGLLFGFLIPLVRARWSASFALVLWIGVLITSFIAFDRGVIMDVVWPTIVIIFAYTGVTLEQRIASEFERRKIKNLFSRYVSPSIVETILRDPTKLNLGGERRHMTVFFSDIRGFTSLSESLEPEEIVSLLNTYLERMTDIVFDHDGVLDKYIGDAIMAFWNAPFNQPNHALRAVEAALHMRTALQDLNAKKTFGDHVLKIGMGINTGEMIVGNTGGKVHTNYTVIGDSVNLASRLESLTKEYGVGIIITQATYDELGGAVLARKLDKVAVKGKNEPVTIFEVITLMSLATVEQKQAVRDYEDALGAYERKQFGDAARLADAVLATQIDDTSAKMLSDRAKAFVVTPPPADWDGTWVYTKK